MSRFLLSCTTCSLRGVERDEILACFRHAPAAGYRYWGLAGPPLWDLGGARWFDAAKVARMAREAGLAGCTEVYGPQFPTDSRESAEAAAEDQVAGHASDQGVLALLTQQDGAIVAGTQPVVATASL